MLERLVNMKKDRYISIEEQQELAQQGKRGFTPVHEGCDFVADVIAGTGVTNAVKQMIETAKLRKVLTGKDAHGNE